MSSPAVRALGGPPLKGRAAVALLDRMGQQPFWPPGPDGWPDAEAGWIGADADLEADRMGRAPWPTATPRPTSIPPPSPQPALGPRLSARDPAGDQAAESPAQGLALFLACPEFQRR